MEYKDIIQKLEYHKQRLIKNFISHGVFPTENEITDSISRIDLRLSIFKQQVFSAGEYVDTNKINYMLNAIYDDISLIYKIINEIQVERFNSMVMNIETHMLELESTAKLYQKRADEEINGTALGKTLLFRVDGWNISKNDDSTVLSLGQIELIEGSKISCFANINNTDKRNIVFKFNAQDNSDDFTALPYNYNNDSYNVPGDMTTVETDINIGDNFNLNSEIKIPYKTNINNSYKILGGAGKMVVTDKLTNNITVVDIPTRDKPFVASKGCFLSFFMKGLGIIEYSFNKKPLHANFSINNGTIDIKDNLQRVFLDVDKGFTCYFDLDKLKGFATNIDGLVDGDSLIYNGLILVRDFKIIEYKKDKKQIYDIEVVITEHDNDEIIDSIYIKEID